MNNPNAYVYYNGSACVVVVPEQKICKDEFGTVITCPKEPKCGDPGFYDPVKCPAPVVNCTAFPDAP